MIFNTNSITSLAGRLLGNPCAVAYEKQIPQMTSKRSQHNEDTKFRVFRLLQNNPEMSQRELAEAVGVSVGGMHFVLSALIEKGFVKLGNFTAAEDKRRYAYILTPKGIANKTALTKRFLLRKMDEYEALKTEIEDLRSEIDDDVHSQFQGSH